MESSKNIKRQNKLLRVKPRISLIWNQIVISAYSIMPTDTYPAVNIFDRKWMREKFPY